MTRLEKIAMGSLMAFTVVATLGTVYVWTYLILCEKEDL